MFLKWFPSLTVWFLYEDKPQAMFLDCDFKEGFVDSQALSE